jgi:Skp family chaperone for outer membrane proteins
MSPRQHALEFHLLNLKALPLIQPVKPSRVEEHRTVLLDRDALERLMAVAGKAHREQEHGTWNIAAAPGKAAPPATSGRAAHLQRLERDLAERMERLQQQARELARREAELERRESSLAEREAAQRQRGRSMALRLEQLVSAQRRLQELSRVLQERAPVSKADADADGR